MQLDDVLHLVRHEKNKLQMGDSTRFILFGTWRKIFFRLNKNRPHQRHPHFFKEMLSNKTATPSIGRQKGRWPQFLSEKRIETDSFWRISIIKFEEKATWVAPSASRSYRIAPVFRITARITRFESPYLLSAFPFAQSSFFFV